MRLLIVTQVLDRNDSVLGFMHDWVAAFARRAERVTVICLRRGEVDLPSSVSVFSLGKEEGASRLTYLFRFYAYLIRELTSYDAVLVHMNYEYVLLGGPLWRLAGKRIGLWYAHGFVPRLLPYALRLAHVVLTSTASGFRIPSAKVRVIGQGINTERFALCPSLAADEETFEVVTVGRISPAKDYETLLAAAELLAARGVNLFVRIAGAPALAADEEYLERLRGLVEEKRLFRQVSFVGPVPNRFIPALLCDADLFVNLGLTGSLDKAVPEAMAAGLPILSCNEAVASILGAERNELIFEKGNSEDLANRIEKLARLPREERRALGMRLREIVLRDHSLDRFVEKALSIVAGSASR